MPSTKDTVFSTNDCADDFLIQMGRHQYLIPFAPKPLRQLHADLMRQLRRGLAGREGLIPMVGDYTVLLAETLFTASISSRAVDGRQLMPLINCRTTIALSSSGVTVVFSARTA